MPDVIDSDRIGPGHVCAHGIRWPHACGHCDDAAWERRERRRRWSILAEDGAIFGLTERETAELAQLEAEFGPSGLDAGYRHSG
jgi:hypothetical protein